MRPHIQEGFLLVSTLVVVMVIAMVAATTSQLIVVNHRVSQSSTYDSNARLAADAAIDHAVQEITNNSAWTGTGTQITLQDTANIKTTYESTVSSIDTITRKITGIGRTYHPSTSSSPTSTRKYEAIAISNSTPSAAQGYSVLSGLGGLNLGTSAEIIGGNIYVNGKVNLGISARIGTPSKPLHVRVGHQSCPIPADATYPRVCGPTEDGQPIYLGTSAAIYGDIMANNQISSTRMYSPGLIVGTVVPAIMPTHDRSGFSAAMTNTMTSTSASCSTGGSVTWPANTKIIGSPSIGSSCTVTIEGDLWITGSVVTGTGSTLRVKDGVTKRPVLMIDGNSGLRLGTGAEILQNASPNRVGIKAITYWSKASCSPDCNVTGSDLANSYTTNTVVLSSGAAAEGSEVFARWTGAHLGTSSVIGAIAAQNVTIATDAVVDFKSQITFSESGSMGTWSIRSYNRTY